MPRTCRARARAAHVPGPGRDDYKSGTNANIRMVRESEPKLSQPPKLIPSGQSFQQPIVGDVKRHRCDMLRNEQILSEIAGLSDEITRNWPRSREELPRSSDIRHNRHELARNLGRNLYTGEGARCRQGLSEHFARPNYPPKR